MQHLVEKKLGLEIITVTVSQACRPYDRLLEGRERFKDLITLRERREKALIRLCFNSSVFC